MTKGFSSEFLDKNLASLNDGYCNIETFVLADKWKALSNNFDLKTTTGAQQHKITSVFSMDLLVSKQAGWLFQV